MVSAMVDVPVVQFYVTENLLTVRFRDKRRKRFLKRYPYDIFLHDFSSTSRLLVRAPAGTILLTSPLFIAGMQLKKAAC